MSAEVLPRLEMERPLWIATRDGKGRVVPARVVCGTKGTLAVHWDRRHNWTVTHVPTGWRMIYDVPKCGALRFARDAWQTARAVGISLESDDPERIKPLEQAMLLYLAHQAG
jgi:hypothetical protein